MRRAFIVTGIVAAGFAMAACGASPPTLPQADGEVISAGGDSGIFTTSGVTKIPISGTFNFVGEVPPGRELVNPNGNYHFWDNPVHTIFDGDVAGPVTFHEKGMITPDGGGVFSGPFEGDVTWDGRSGTISGQFTTNCRPDPTTGYSCDGVLNAKGSGGLDGVRFKFVWGPGFYPFPYTGTAYVK